jgi:hypothetical protein
MSNITEEDVSILMSQANITKEQAREILIINNGNLVDSLVDFESGKIDLNKLNELKKKEVKEDDETLDFEVDTSKQENLVRYREIVDEKDTIYNKNKIEKEEREQKAKEIQERRDKGEKVEDDVKPNFSIEDLYLLKKGNNSFNSIRVL